MKINVVMMLLIQNVNLLEYSEIKQTNGIYVYLTRQKQLKLNFG